MARATSSLDAPPPASEAMSGFTLPRAPFRPRTPPRSPRSSARSALPSPGTESPCFEIQSSMFLDEEGRKLIAAALLWGYWCGEQEEEREDLGP